MPACRSACPPSRAAPLVSATCSLAVPRKTNRRFPRSRWPRCPWSLACLVPRPTTSSSPARDHPACRWARTSHHRSFGAFSGSDVTVIDGGQSALETAALAREQGAIVRVIMRHPRLVWNGVPHLSLIHCRSGCAVRRLVSATAGGCCLRQFAGHLPPAAGTDAGPGGRAALGPAAAWWLKERVLGQLPLLTGHTVIGVETDSAGTGYRGGPGATALSGRPATRTSTAGGRGPRCRPASRRRRRTCTSSGWRPRTVSDRSCGSSTARTTAPRRLVGHSGRVAGAPFLAPAVW